MKRTITLGSRKFLLHESSGDVAGVYLDEFVDEGEGEELIPRLLFEETRTIMWPDMKDEDEHIILRYNNSAIMPTDENLELIDESKIDRRIFRFYRDSDENILIFECSPNGFILRTIFGCYGTTLKAIVFSNGFPDTRIFDENLF